MTDNKTTRLRLGTQIFTMRTAKNLTQAKLASELGISPGTLSVAERGLPGVNFESLVAIRDLVAELHPHAEVGTQITTERTSNPRARFYSEDFPAQREALRKEFAEYRAQSGKSVPTLSQELDISYGTLTRVLDPDSSMSEGMVDLITTRLKTLKTTGAAAPGVVAPAPVTAAVEESRDVVVKTFTVLRTEATSRLADYLTKDGKTTYRFMQSPEGLLILAGEG